MSINRDNTEILTKDNILEILQEFSIDDSVEVHDHSLHPYSEHKLDYTGSHLQLTITIKRTNENRSVEKYKFFVKAILQNSQTQHNFMSDEGIFMEEFVFFQKVKPLLMENYKNKSWSPICYLAKKEFLVMEDLTINGFKLPTNLLDKTSHIKSSLETLGRFHACSILAEARLTRLRKEPVFLNEYFPNNLKEKFFSEKKSTLHNLIENAMNLVFALAESFGRSSQKIRKIYEKLYEVVKPSKIHRNVICHGDLWANNIMFNDAEPELQCVFVDFQTVRYAPNVLDILQLLYLNTTSNYRKEHEQEFIKVYSTALARTIKNNDETETAIAPTYDEILEAYENSRFFGVSLASFYLPFILLDQEIINEIIIGLDGSDTTRYSNKMEMTFAYMQRNESYKNRIEEVINELADIADH